MLKPQWPERLYLNLDGLFASAEQFAHPHLRGRPVGVIPAHVGAQNIIACSREAKKRGISDNMPIAIAKETCPEIILWPQTPDLFRRSHNEILSEIKMVVPIDAMMTANEMTCKLNASQMRDPLKVGIDIKGRLHSIFGDTFTCAIGYAANRFLAKMASEHEPDCNLAWWPSETDAILRTKKLTDVPGVNDSTLPKLLRAGVTDMNILMDRRPGEMRSILGDRIGARMYHSLHGYEIPENPVKSRHIGYSRIVPHRAHTIDDVKSLCHVMMVKAIGRIRRENLRAGRIGLELELIRWDGTYQWKCEGFLPQLFDYSGILAALNNIWTEAKSDIANSLQVSSISVWLNDFSPITERQLELITQDNVEQTQREYLSDMIEDLQHRFYQSKVTLGWTPHYMRGFARSFKHT